MSTQLYEFEPKWVSSGRKLSMKDDGGTLLKRNKVQNDQTESAETKYI